MIFDTSKTGLETLLLPYQVAALRFIWKNGEGISRTIYDNQWKTMEPEDRRSRASIIKYLTKSVDDGLLSSKEVPTQGGYTRFYYPCLPTPDEGSFKRTMAEIIIEKVKTELLI